MRIEIIKTGEIQPYGKWRAAHSEYSIPIDPTNEVLATLGARHVIETAPPVVDKFHVAVESGLDEDGRVLWTVNELSPGEQAEVIANRRKELLASASYQRDTLEQNGFAFRGKRVHSDAVSVQRISTAALTSLLASLTDTPFSVDWKCIGGEHLTLDAAGMQDMVATLTTYSGALHQHAQALYASIEEAADLAALEAIDVAANWPLQAAE